MITVAVVDRCLASIVGRRPRTQRLVIPEALRALLEHKAFSRSSIRFGGHEILIHDVGSRLEPAAAFRARATLSSAMLALIDGTKSSSSSSSLSDALQVFSLVLSFDGGRGVTLEMASRAFPGSGRGRRPSFV